MTASASAYRHARVPQQVLPWHRWDKPRAPGSRQKNPSGDQPWWSLRWGQQRSPYGETPFTKWDDVFKLHPFCGEFLEVFWKTPGGCEVFKVGNNQEPSRCTIISSLVINPFKTRGPCFQSHPFSESLSLTITNPTTGCSEKSVSNMSPLDPKKWHPKEPFNKFPVVQWLITVFCWAIQLKIIWSCPIQFWIYPPFFYTHKNPKTFGVQFHPSTIGHSLLHPKPLALRVHMNLDVFLQGVGWVRVWFRQEIIQPQRCGWVENYYTPRSWAVRKVGILSCFGKVYNVSGLC